MLSLRLLAGLNAVTYSCSVHQSLSASLHHTLSPQVTPAVFPGLCASCWLHSALKQHCSLESFYKQSYKGSIPTSASTLALLAVLVPNFPPGFSFSMPWLFSGLWAHVLCPGKLVSQGTVCPCLASAQSWDAASGAHTSAEILVPKLQSEILKAPQSSCLLGRRLCAYTSGWEASASGTAA